MKMKVRVSLLLAMGLATAAVLAGCSSSGSTSADTEEAAVAETTEEASASTEDDAEEETQTESESSGYVFEAEGVTLAPDMDADALVAELGEAKSVYEVPSCAGQGTAYLYDYGSYEIETYPDDDGNNLVAYITLMDDTVATPEGIDLSNTKEDVIGIYGDGYTETDNGLIYETGSMKLEFIFDGEDMSSIEYVSLVL
ncbi:MAG: hypothetical protein LUD53_01615 [Clostridiales bacterium]|nr:hypothetical protein [Clostridiales bacterium]